MFQGSSMVEHSAVNRVVAGSSPARGVYTRPVGQAVKTSPFHGGNRGSIPLGVTIWGVSSVGRASALQAGGHRFEPCTPHQQDLGSS